MKKNLNKQQAKALQSAHLFKYFEKKHHESVKAYGEYCYYSAGDIILKQGNPGHGLFILLSGHVNVSVVALGKGKMSLAKLTPGEFFGEVSLLENIFCTATVTASDEVCCYYLRKSCYDAFAILMPEIRYHINRAFIENVVLRQRGMFAEIRELMMRPRMRSTVVLSRSTSTPSLKQHSSHNLTQKFDYLYGLPVFSQFTKEEFDIFLNHSKLIETSKHYNLTQIENEQSSVYFIVNGSVQVSVNQDDFRAKITVHGPNTIICPLGIFDNKRDFFNFITNDTAILLQLTPQNLKKLELLGGNVWYKTYELLCRSILSLQSKLNRLIVRLANEQLESIIKE